MRKGVSKNAIELVFFWPNNAEHAAYALKQFSAIPWRKLNFYS